MKKTIFTAAVFALFAVSSIMLIPNRAEALPAFARQTGAACLSCHFQTFPALKAFGREFMFNSFTDVGDQALVEDDNLSIPAVLNMSMDVAATATHTTGDGSTSQTTYTIPDKARLFIAGRVGEHTGAFIMFMGGGDNKPGPFLNKKPIPVWMLLNSVRLNDDWQVGLGLHKSPWGASNAMEVSNVFGHRGDKLAGQDVSAIKAAGFTKLTTGMGIWARYKDLGYIQIAAVAPAGETTGVTNLGTRWGYLLRAVATLDINGWDTLIGFGYVTGTAGAGGNGGTTAAGFLPKPGTTKLENVRVPMNLQFIDVQLQGEIGDTSVGIYGDWAHAAGRTSSGGTGNFYGSAGAPAGSGFGDATVTGGNPKFNTAGKTFDAYSIRTEIEPVNRFLFGIGYGYKRLQDPASGDIKTQTLQLAATYKVYQNMDINLVFDNAKTTDPTGTLSTSGLKSFTNRTTVLSVEALM